MSRSTRRRLGDWLTVAACVALAATLAWTLTQIQTQGERVDALAAALEAEQQAAEDRGETPVAPEAEEIIEDPEVAEEDVADAPSDEQVLAAVEAYFREHPVEDGEDASGADIAAAVINYLTENPVEDGEPGPAPTDEQILAAVATYLTENPPAAGADGEDGQDGEDGHTPTSEEIQAELAAYLEANPIQMCPSGTAAEAHTVLTTGGTIDAIVCVQQQEEN